MIKGCAFPSCQCVARCRLAYIAPADRPGCAVASPSRPSRGGAVGQSCPYCGETMHRDGPRCATHDHVQPRSRGGSNAPHNILVVCWQCNNDKGDMLLEEFAYVLRRRGDSRAERVAAIAAQRSTPATVAAE